MFSVPWCIRLIPVKIGVLILALLMSFSVQAATVGGHVDLQVVSLSDVGYVEDTINNRTGERASLMTVMRQRPIFVHEEKTAFPDQGYAVLILSY